VDLDSEMPTRLTDRVAQRVKKNLKELV